MDARIKSGHPSGPTLPIFEWRARANQHLIGAGQRRQAVSRHHITPPAVYLPPPPKPKETRRKRRVGHAQGASDVGESEEAGDITATRNARPLPQQIPVADAMRKIPLPNGKLSDDTLKAMLQVQEQESGK
jgi:hypothetical protein